MQRLRCPYCKHRFTPEKAEGLCPACAKAFIVPGRLRKTTYRDRQRLRDKIAANADRERRTQLAIDSRFGRNPRILGGFLLVLVILGALLVQRASRIASSQRRLNTLEDKAHRELYVLNTALGLFLRDTGRYPEVSEGLRALVQNPGVDGWKGHYVNIIKPDPWHTPYLYTPSSTPPGLSSCGPDRLPFTDDDIVAPPPSPPEN